MSEALSLVNDILQSVIVIFSVAVVLYNLPFFGNDRLIRAFSLLLTAVSTVYFTELLVNRTIQPGSAEPWLYLKWAGIVFVPAIQFHLSDALLGITGLPNIRRRVFATFIYLSGTLFLGLVIFSNAIIIGTPNELANAIHFLAGRWFLLFGLYYVGVTAASIRNVWRAYSRSVTTNTRRRMRYILFASIAAPLSVFPYLSLTNNGMEVVPTPLWLLLIAGNLLVGFLFAILTLNILYLGSLSSQRIVRVRLYKFMARVPFTASVVLLVYILTNKASAILGVNQETATGIMVVATLMLVEWAIHAYKSVLERVLQFNNEPDVRRIQDLSERLLTSQDLTQFLESILAAACNTLRAPSAFIASYTADGLPKLEVLIESLKMPEQDISFESFPSPAELDNLNGTGLHRWNGYIITPLTTRQDDALVGFMGLYETEDTSLLSADARKVFDHLQAQTASALEDRLLQQGIFAAVDGILPSITAIQQQRNQLGSTVRLQPAEPEPEPAESLHTDPDFKQQIRQALQDIYGGRGLTESPLLNLQIVQSAAHEEYGGDPVRALKAILKRAIDMQKPPESQQSLTRTEWLLYNILELEYIEGQKIRNIARRLAISESTYYRRKRDAIENIGRTISDLENEVLREHDE